MTIKRGQFALFIVILLVVLLLLPSLSLESSNSILLHFTFLLNGTIIILFLVIEAGTLPYSCRTLHWVFFLFFFFLSPYLQFLFKQWPLNYSPTVPRMIRANLLIMLWSTLFHLTRKVQFSKGGDIFFDATSSEMHIKHPELFVFSESSDDNPSKARLTLFLFISFVLVLYLVSRVGLITLVSSRSGGYSAYQSSSSAESSLISNTVRNTISFTAFLNAYRFQKKRDNLSLLIISFALLMIGCSPFGLPRFQVAAIYLTIIILLFPKWRYSSLSIIGFIVFFMLVFPLINAYRYTEVGMLDFKTLLIRTINNFQGEYLTANYDAYTIMLKMFDYVDENSYTYGRQLICAILFFIPRTVWPSKSVSTGALLQAASGAHSSAYNVSSSLIVEGMIDFGIFGVILYCFLFSLICNRIDAKLAMPDRYSRATTIIQVLMPPLLFFLLRGSLLSVWPFIASYLVVGFAMIKLR